MTLNTNLLLEALMNLNNFKGETLFTDTQCMTLKKKLESFSQMEKNIQALNHKLDSIPLDQGIKIVSTMSDLHYEYQNYINNLDELVDFLGDIFCNYNEIKKDLH